MEPTVLFQHAKNNQQNNDRLNDQNNFFFNQKSVIK